MFKEKTTFSEAVGAGAFATVVLVLAIGSFMFEGELRSTAVNACQGMALVGIGYFLRSRRDQAGDPDPNNPPPGPPDRVAR